MRFLLLVALIAPALLSGCCSSSCTVPETEWIRNSPEQTFELFQRAARCDDAEAAYSTLTRETKQRIPISDFYSAWDYAGDKVRALCHTKLIQVENAAGPTPGKKATFRYKEITVSFLMLQEDGMWLFRYPSPYHSEEEIQAAMEKIADDAGDCCE